ncbi:MAG TPA: ATP phosphoribosyltransferase [Pyrinomonadaceae bacterium]|nr:ATP phosphoribosyltransferase [Pyrinomonadaceae bacterium]
MTNSYQKNLKVAIQKQGRLSEGSVDLLRKCGIGFSNGMGKLKTVAPNFPLEIYFLRDDDIPEYVADGVADVGIVGENVLGESQRELCIVERLGFGKCRMALALPKGREYASIQDVEGMRVATSYPRTLQSYLDANGVGAEIHAISGSVEIAPSIGLADAVCDLVSSGSTLFSNGLREVATVMTSEAVFISRPDLTPEVSGVLDKLLFRLRSVKAARQNKYILLNAPVASLEAIEQILPGINSPTITPLADPAWVSFQAVIEETDFWDKVDGLKAAGAEGILVLSIDQMIR